jgi:ankyrin repeat protein
MDGSVRCMWIGMAAAILFAPLTSCRKPADAMKSDLGEAGYQLTTADWFRASRTDDTAALKKFIAAGFAIDSRDERGDSALHAAVAVGAKNAADFLMDRGLAVDLKGSADHTPLMAAVLGNQAAMVRWLLRQGADPRAKDKDGFMPLMLAVREGKSGPAAELAPYTRDSLDSAILLAALVGQPKSIDILTNYGASVYARMEDGRSPLMVAAQNGHTDAVKLLLDLGSSRFSTDAEGHTAADLATTAGHTEIAALIARDPLPDELALQTPEEVATAMDAVADASAATTSTENATPDSATTAQAKSPSIPIRGQTLSAAAPVKPQDTPADTPAQATETLPLPPIVMRQYRERELPLQVRSVQQETATLAITGKTTREVQVRAGETVPGTRLTVLRVQRRMQSGKLDDGNPQEVSVVEVRDSATGTSRELVSGIPSSAHDPLALIEDAATGRRYTASPGQRFTSADGTEFIISDVRPNQIVIRDAATGNSQTLPLRGPRG